MVNQPRRLAGGSTLTATALGTSFDSIDIKGPVRVREVTLDFSAFLVGGARDVALFWARGAVASQADFNKEAEGNFAKAEELGGRGSAFVHELDMPVEDRRFIVARVISIDPTERAVGWSVTGHDL